MNSKQSPPDEEFEEIEEIAEREATDATQPQPVELQQPQPSTPEETKIPIAPVEIPGVAEKIPGVRRSTRTRLPTTRYIPSMKGKTCDVTATQVNTLHPDAHLSFVQDMMGEKHDAVATIMTQLPLKTGLKTWGAKARKAAKSEMNQLHM